MVMTIMGIPPEDILKDSSKLLDMVHPEDQEMFRDAIMKSYETLESFPLTGPAGAFKQKVTVLN